MTCENSTSTRSIRVMLAVAVMLVALPLNAEGTPEAQRGMTETSPQWSKVSVTLPTSTSLFPAGEGATIASSQCLICHSAEMVLSQPPRTESQWKETINKMRTSYGAPMPAEEVDTLAAYFARVLASDHRERTASSASTSVAANNAPAPADGAAVFAGRCAVCHQTSGTGISGAFPPLAGSDWVKGHDVALVQILLHGVQGTLTVNGTPYNSAMPAFADQLSDPEIAAVLTYVRSQWGNAAAPVDAAVVRAQRAATNARVNPWNGEAELTPFRK